MGEQISVPTGDISTQWNITPAIPPYHYANVDVAWQGNTTDNIHEIVNYQSDQFSFPADGPAAMVTVHTIHFDMYLNTTNVAQIPGLTFVLSKGVVFVASKSYQVDTSGAWSRRRFTFTGLSLTKAEYNTVRIMIMTVPGDPGWPIPEVV